MSHLPFFFFFFRNWKMTWRVISLATSSISWWPSWLLRQCLMRSSWRNPWRYEPYTSHFCPGFDYVIKNGDFLPMHTWDMGVNLIDLGVILYLYSPISRTTVKWEAVVEPWTQVILGWKDIVILIYLFLTWRLKFSILLPFKMNGTIINPTG